MSEKFDCPQCGQDLRLPADTQKRIRTLESRLAEAKEAIEKFVNDFDKLRKRQHELLVEGQNLESASKNWQEFPDDFSISIEPLREALAAIGGRSEK